MTFIATKARMLNRGTPPDSFLSELVEWGRRAPAEIFDVRLAPEGKADPDVYASIRTALGPWSSSDHRRAAMLETMRVLAGFESSWNWNEGVDTTNQTSITPETIGADLMELVDRVVGSRDGKDFQKVTKSNHEFAMDYIARLLRHTTHHNGPVLRHEIDPWLSRAAVNEFQAMLA